MPRASVLGKTSKPTVLAIRTLVCFIIPALYASIFSGRGWWRRSEGDAERRLREAEERRGGRGGRNKQEARGRENES